MGMIPQDELIVTHTTHGARRWPMTSTLGSDYAGHVAVSVAARATIEELWGRCGDAVAAMGALTAHRRPTRQQMERVRALAESLALCVAYIEDEQA